MTTFHSLSKKNKTASSKGGGPFYGKVTRVSYDKATPDQVGSIFFRNLTDPDGLERNQAYPLFPFLKNVPLVDEVVLLIPAPSNSTDKGVNKSRTYYISTVSIWNHPHHSATTEDKDTVELDTAFTERADVNPMYPYPGDTILEGRLGQSLRFSQSIPNETPWVGSLSSPIVILSNGQVEVEDGFSPITEDINKDFASLYLTDRQKLSITPGNKLTQPLGEYDKPQAILTAGRLVLNARDNNLILSTPLALEASGRVINIKAEDTITNQALKIKLGEQADQRAILGDRMLSDLSAVLVELVKVTTALSSLGIAPLTAPAADFTARAITFISEVEQMKSNRVFIQK